MLQPNRIRLDAEHARCPCGLSMLWEVDVSKDSMPNPRHLGDPLLLQAMTPATSNIIPLQPFVRRCLEGVIQFINKNVHTSEIRGFSS